ncbi:MAG: NUDIX domain-containing protein [Ignavibacteria bacterium]|nr:NUDIX domain-containing protein [Ignavibacteria bacterium]
MAKEYSAGIITYYRDENDGQIKFLIIKHRKGHWSFPKGHIEDGEDIKSAAIREVEEETGLKNIKILGEDINGNYKEFLLSENYIIESNQVNKTNYYYIGEVESPQGKDKHPEVRIDEDEILEYRWCNYQEALNIITYKLAKDILKQAYDIIKEKNKRNYTK